MEKYENFTYEIGNNLYINLTSRCTNACTFCVRNDKADYFGHKLWLAREPAAEEVIARLPADIGRYGEYVFCGFGEPTIRLDALLAVANEIRRRGGTTRLNTNGQANMIHRRDVTGELAGAVDKINVSLNEARTRRRRVREAVQTRLRRGRLCRAAGFCQKVRRSRHRHLVFGRGHHRRTEDRPLPRDRGSLRRGAEGAPLHRLKALPAHARSGPRPKTGGRSPENKKRKPGSRNRNFTSGLPFSFVS